MKIRKPRGPRMRLLTRRPSVFKMGELPGDHQDQRDAPPLMQIGHFYTEAIVPLRGELIITPIERQP